MKFFTCNFFSALQQKIFLDRGILSKAACTNNVGDVAGSPGNASTEHGSGWYYTAPFRLSALRSAIKSRICPESMLRALILPGFAACSGTSAYLNGGAPTSDGRKRRRYISQGRLNLLCGTWLYKAASRHLSMRCRHACQMCRCH